MKATFKSLFTAALASLLFACGVPVDEFVGLWEESGSQTTTYNLNNGSQTYTGQFKESLTVMEGARSDLIVKGEKCTLPYDVDGPDVATLSRGATCTYEEDGILVTFTFISGAIQRGERYSTASLSAQFTLVFDGMTIPGTVTQTSTWTKLSK